jgi:hypothetical protein
MLMRHKFSFFRSGTTEGSGGGTEFQGSGVDSGAIDSEVRAILDFDPFTPEPEAAPGNGGGAEPLAATQTEGSPTPPLPLVPVAPTAPPVMPAPPPLDPNAPPPVAKTEAQIMAEAAAAFKEAATALKQPAPATPQQAPQQPEPDEFAPRDDNDQPLDYRQINIPDQLLNAMNSENPMERKAAVTQLISSSMATAHRMAVSQSTRMMQQTIARVLPGYVAERIQQHERQREVFTDFYQTYPDLSAPAIRPIILEQAQALQKHYGNPGWTPQFRDALGTHVRNMLRGFAPPTGAPAPAAPLRAPAGVMTPPSARPSAVVQPSRANAWDDLFDPN